MTTQAAAPTVREVTDEEASFYRENGWVMLEQFINPDDAGEILERVKGYMGPDGDTTSHPDPARDNGQGPFFNTYSPLSVDVISGDVIDEFFNGFSHSHAVARAGTKLQGEPVRFWVDQALVKVPVSRNAVSSVTDWHIDLVLGGTNPTPFANPSDQSLLWFALTDIPPERGSMRFIGRKDQSDEVWKVVKEMSLEDSYPVLEEMGVISPELYLQPGDATVHAGPTMHSALRNTTDQGRWVYNMVVFPARTEWTGNRYWPNEGVDMNGVGEQFPDHRFPILT